MTTAEKKNGGEKEENNDVYSGHLRCGQSTVKTPTDWNADHWCQYSYFRCTLVSPSIPDIFLNPAIRKGAISLIMRQLITKNIAKLSPSRSVLVKSNWNSHGTTDIKLEMLSGVQTGNGTPHDKYNV